MLALVPNLQKTGVSFGKLHINNIINNLLSNILRNFYIKIILNKNHYY